jgi:biopolymer transport protein ExbD
MRFRKKHKGESEVFTDSLNDILFILLMFFLIVATIANPNLVKVNNPRAAKDAKAKQNIIVTIDKDQQLFLGSKAIDKNMLDTLLSIEVNKYRKSPLDSPSVVINADTVAHYGEVFRIMRAAKKAGAKSFAQVK